VPGPPDELKVTNITNTSCTLAWNAPQIDGGSLITGYYVEMYNESDWIRIKEVPATAECRIDIDGLLEDAENVFRVSAVNNVGVGPPSVSTLSVSTFGKLKPGFHYPS